MSNGFTKIDNSILDKDISFDAKGIYMVISRYISIPGFQINKTHIKSVTGLGFIRFNRAWKELKERGILIQEKKSINGRFQYTYSLGKEKIKATVPVKEKTKHIDSDGNTPIAGQMSVGDVMEQQEEEIKTEHTTDTTRIENISAVAKETGFNDVQAKELLKVARNDVNKVIQVHKHTMRQSGIKNIYAYTRWAIKNINLTNVVESGPNIKSGPFRKQDSFNNYQQRDYDYNKLENLLLYGKGSLKECMKG